MTTFAKVSLEAMRSGLLTIGAAIRRVRVDLTAARSVAAFFFFWHRDSFNRLSKSEAQSEAIG
jgi:hypothetical protein